MKLTMRATALGKKITLMATALILAVSSLSAAVPFIAAQQAHATNGVVEIHTSADLRTAIENQADGQTWKIYAGTYAVTPTDAITAGGQKGWYLPITANNLTVSGVGNPTIYGDGYSANGAWATQDLVAIFGNNVTLNGLTFMPKVEANKAIEVMGDNSTIKNVTVTPNTLSGQSDPWGGSIYYNNATAQTTHTLNNVTVKNGGVSIHAPHATINATDVTIKYRTNVDWINQYRFKVADNTTVLNGAPVYIYEVSNGLNNIEGAIEAAGYAGTIAGSSETIKLISDLYASHQINITKPNLTIDAKRPVPGDVYYTIFGNFDKTSNSNNAVISVKANGVRINQLNVDGRNHQLHGINTYGAQDLQLWRVTVKNNGFSGLNVNRSWVQGTDLTTEHNGWHGVDVDQPGAFFQSAGINHHNETLTHDNRPVPALYVDDVAVGTVSDTNGQYVSVDNYLKAGDRAYFLKADVAAVTNLRIKYSNSGSHLANGATVKKTTDGTGNLVLDFDKPVSTFAVDHYITTETRPDGTTATQWNGYNNTWITQNGFEFGLHGNGEYTYAVTVYYQNGTSATSAPISLWFDTQSPVSAFTEAPANGSFVNGNFHVAATASDSARLKNVLFDVRDPQDTTGNAYRAGCVAGTMNIHYSADYKSAVLDCEINTNSLTEGHQYIVRVHAGDYAGYGSAATNSVRTFTVDRTAPSVPAVVSPLDGTTVKSSALAKVEWDVSTDNLTAQSAIKYEYRLYQVNPETTPNAAIRYQKDYVGQTTHSASGTPAGTYWWRVRACDQAGNCSAWTSAQEFTVDNSVRVTLKTIAENTATPVISGSLLYNADGSPAVGTALQVYVDGAVYSATTDTQGLWSVNPTVAAGLHDVAVVFAGADPATASLATQSFTTTLGQVLGDESATGNGGANQNQNQDRSAHNATLPAIVGPSVLGDATNTPSTSTNTSNKDGAPSVEGTSTEKTLAAAVNNTDGNAFGLAWYWWLLIVAAFAALVWWIVAGIRNHQAEN